MQVANQNTLFQAELAILFSHRRNTLTVLHLFRESGGSMANTLYSLYIYAPMDSGVRRNDEMELYNSTFSAAC